MDDKDSSICVYRAVSQMIYLSINKFATGDKEQDAAAEKEKKEKDEAISRDPH